MIPVFKPYMPQNVEADIAEILYSGQLAYGKCGREFENSLSEFIGNPKVITTATYNHALLIALSVLDLKTGDEIIANPVSCLASNQPFAVKGLKIIWSDINPETGTVNPESIRSQISPNTKAIFNNLFCGYAGDLDAVYAIGKEFGIPVIDDCIEGFGTEFKGKKTGNTGADITVFSFQTVRLPNTIDGGALTFKDENLYEKAKKIRDYGIDRTKFRTANGEISADCDITLEGYGATMSEINSLIGNRQTSDLPGLFEIQRENAKIWNGYFQNNSVAELLKINGNVSPNYWVYGVLADNKPKFIEEMRARGFYATGVHINNNIYSVFNNQTELPGVSEFMKSFVALPCGWWIKNLEDELSH